MTIKRKVFITGASGYVGSELTRQLTTRDEFDVATDDDRTLAPPADTDAVVHLGWNIAERNKLLPALDDVRASFELAHNARKAGVGIFIFASTYIGNETTYGWAKRTVESRLESIGIESAISVRLPNLYGGGPRRNPNIVAAMLDASIQDKPFWLRCHPQTILRLLHVEDAARTLVNLIDICPFGCKTLHAAAEPPITAQQLIDAFRTNDAVNTIEVVDDYQLPNPLPPLNLLNVERNRTHENTIGRTTRNILDDLPLLVEEAVALTASYA